MLGRWRLFWWEVTGVLRSGCAFSGRALGTARGAALLRLMPGMLFGTVLPTLSCQAGRRCAICVVRRWLARTWHVFGCGGCCPKDLRRISSLATLRCVPLGRRLCWGAGLVVGIGLMALGETMARCLGYGAVGGALLPLPMARTWRLAPMGRCLARARQCLGRS